MRARIPSAIASLATLAMLLLLVGCGSANEAVPIPEESAAGALRARLETAGLDVIWLGTSQRSDFFFPEARRATLQIDGADGALVNLYRFPSAEEAADDAGRVGRGGSPVPADGGPAYVSWTGRPHFFRQGRLIALFCESGSVRPTRRDRLVQTALQEVMGPEFAGLSRD